MKHPQLLNHYSILLSSSLVYITYIFSRFFMCHYCYAYYTEYCKYKTYYKGRPFIAPQINYGQRKHRAP